MSFGRHIGLSGYSQIRLRMLLLLCLLIVACKSDKEREDTGSWQTGLTGFEVEKRILLADGASFGEAGPYETLKGRAFYTLNPSDSRNARVTDIEYARDSDGLVRFSSEFVITKPVNSELGNGMLLYSVPNRGDFNKRLLDAGAWSETLNNPSGSADFHGRLMKQGWILVFSGWQADLLPDSMRLHLYVPDAERDGKPMPGDVLAEFGGGPGKKTAALGSAGHRPYAVNPDFLDQAQMRVHTGHADSGMVIESSRWQIASTDKEGNLLPDSVNLHFPEGFQRHRKYTFRYRTNRSPLMGLCFPAVRDLVAFLRSSNPMNPMISQDRKSTVSHTLAFGSSQSGRFLLNYLYQGFNESLVAQRVFDGIYSQVPGCRMGFFNYRHAQPSRYEGFFPNFDFPFTPEVSRDPVIGSEGGIFQLTDKNHQPKMMIMHHSAEYWSGGAALTHADVLGSGDINPPDNVRIYLLNSTAHGFAHMVEGQPDDSGRYNFYYRFNPINRHLLENPLLEKLARWVSTDEAPPPNNFPRLDKGELVSLADFSFPQVPYAVVPAIVDQHPRYDWGPRFRQGILDKPMPGIGELYPVLVPSVDEDGNEMAGFKTPWTAVPLASYTGWNYSRNWSGSKEEPMINLTGSWFPFSRDEAQRSSVSDSRRSLMARYHDKTAYLDSVRHVAESMIGDGLIFGEDLEMLMEESSAMYDYVSEKGAWTP